MPKSFSHSDAAALRLLSAALTPYFALTIPVITICQMKNPPRWTINCYLVTLIHEARQSVTLN
jgi:hypothetical protein